MLTTNAINHGLQIANSATSRGLMLGAVPNSPVDEIIKAVSGVDAESFQQNPVEHLQAKTRESKLSIVSHAATKASLSEAIGTILEGRVLRGIRDDIYPLCREIKAKIDEESLRISRDHDTNMTVVTLEEPDIYGYNYVEQMLSGSSVTPSTFNMRQGLKDKLLADVDEASLQSMLTTANEDLNRKLGVVLAGVVSLPVDGYGRFLYSSILLEQRPVMGMKALYGDHSALTSLMFLRAVNANKHPTVKVDDLTSDDRMEIARAVSYFRGAVVKKIEQLNREMRSTSPFAYYDKGERRIYVRGPQYTRWIDGGGEIEAIMGCVLSHGGANMDLCIDNGEKYKAVYEKRVKIEEAKARQITDNRIEQMLEQELVRYIREEADESETAKERMLADISQAREFMKTYRKYPKQDVEQYVSIGVCRTIGRDINAEVIYSEMTNFLAEEGNEEKKAGEAVIVAVARLVGRYLGKQIVSEEVKVLNSYEAPMTTNVKA
jgi:hypothetical protein